MLSVTVVPHRGREWKIIPQPSTPHIIEMIDLAIQANRAFDMVVPHGDHLIAYNSGSKKITKKTAKKIERAVEAAAIGKKFEVIFIEGA